MTSPDELTAIAARLQALLAELDNVATTARDAAGVVELDQARVGRLSRMDALQAQALSQETNRRRELQIKRIQSAIGRIERGEYGDCLRCGEPMDERRLKVDPAATLCIACAEASDGAP